MQAKNTMFEQVDKNGILAPINEVETKNQQRKDDSANKVSHTNTAIENDIITAEQVTINGRKIYHKDDQGNYIVNLSKPVKADDKEMKSIVIKTLKSVKDYRDTASSIKAYMDEKNIIDINKLNIELDSELFNKIFRMAVYFNDQPVSLTAVNDFAIEDYLLVSKLLNNLYLAFFR